MLHRLLSTIISIVACIAVNAQEVCVINGNITDVHTAGGAKVKKLFLVATDEFGRDVEVASARVRRGSYTFNVELAEGDHILMYKIKGFGEDKGIEVFVEPGIVTVQTESAAAPEESVVSGTPTNDGYCQYKAIGVAGIAAAEAQISALAAGKAPGWAETEEGKAESQRIRAKEYIITTSQLIRFLLEHNASPMTPFVIERDILPQLSAVYGKQMTNSISTTLYGHPYYRSLRNRMLSNNMQVGSEVPDITMPMLGGETKHLTDFRGKYVILNFWSSDSDESAEMIAEMQRVYEIVKSADEQFVIISFSLNENVGEWKSAVEANNMNREGWLNACDAAGAESLAAELFGVEAAPKIVLVEPEGLAVSLNMETDEVVMRVEQILSGDLYYLDQID